ncbi:MAG: DUF4124 domain-containing protein [Rhodocyclaceae bacterium]
MSKSGTLAALALLALAGTVQAQIYTWKDAKGSVHYSDQPPPGVDAKVTSGARGAAAAPATAATASAPVAGSKSWQEKDQEFRQRRAEQSEKNAKQQEADAKRAQRDAQCAEIRRQLAAVDSGARMGHTNDKGEVEVFGDAERKAESQRLRDILSKECGA